MSVADFQKALKEPSLILGTARTLTRLRKGQAKKVFLSSNCPAAIREEILHLAAKASIPVVQLPVPNAEVGVLCKKPYAVSVACY